MLFTPNLLALKTAGKEKKRKDCVFQRQFSEKPSVIPGCPGIKTAASCHIPVTLIKAATSKDNISLPAACMSVMLQLVQSGKLSIAMSFANTVS